MDDLIKLVKTYRLTAALDQRLLLAERIIALIATDLRLFIVPALPAHAPAEDVLQETLLAIVTGLGKFRGNAPREFWGWCYAIARNKIATFFRMNGAESERLVVLTPEELWQIVETSAAAAPLATGERLDLEHAMKLLAASKPECVDYLWAHYVLGLDYAEIAEAQSLGYDNVRMRIGRCLEEAKSLVS